MQAARNTDQANSYSDAERQARLAALDLAEAGEAWRARVEAAVAAVELPASPYRIRRKAGEEHWIVEAARVYQPDAPPFRSYGTSAQLSYHPGGYRQSTRLAASDYREDREPLVHLYWERIGPDRPVGDGQRLSYETAPFFTFADAKRWLLLYLKPSDETYFDANGKPSAAP